MQGKTRNIGFLEKKKISSWFCGNIHDIHKPQAHVNNGPQLYSLH